MNMDLPFHTRMCTNRVDGIWVSHVDAYLGLCGDRYNLGGGVESPSAQRPVSTLLDYPSDSFHLYNHDLESDYAALRSAKCSHPNFVF